MNVDGFFRKYGSNKKLKTIKNSLNKVTRNFTYYLLTLCGRRVSSIIKNKFENIEIDAYGFFYNKNVTSVDITIYNINKKALSTIDGKLSYLLDLSIWDKWRNKRKKLVFMYKYIIEVERLTDNYSLALRKKLVRCEESKAACDLSVTYFPVCNISLLYLLNDKNLETFDQEIIKSLDKYVFNK